MSVVSSLYSEAMQPCNSCGFIEIRAGWTGPALNEFQRLDTFSAHVDYALRLNGNNTSV